MKRILTLVTLVGILFFTSVSWIKAPGNGCAAINLSDLTVTPGPFFRGQ